MSSGVTGLVTGSWHFHERVGRHLDHPLMGNDFILGGDDTIVLRSLTMDATIDAGPGNDVVRTPRTSGSVVVNGASDEDGLISGPNDLMSDVRTEEVMIASAAMASVGSLNSISDEVMVTNRHDDAKRSDQEKRNDQAKHIDERIDFRAGAYQDAGENTLYSRGEMKSSASSFVRHAQAAVAEWVFGQREDRAADAADTAKRTVRIDWDDEVFGRSTMVSRQADGNLTEFGPPTDKSRAK